MTEPVQDPRVDELRQRLRGLGYLDAGVDRFVLGPAVGSRRPAVIALLASLRIGMIAAALLGPAAAIGLGARLPGLVTGPRDAVVIALYMGALFGVAVTLAAFAASIIVASLAGQRVARRAATLSLAAGAAVSIVCLVYLTLWWRSANAGFGWSAPVWTGFALLVAVAISLLLGHAVQATAVAVIVAGRGAGEAVDEDRRDRSGRSIPWKMSAMAGALAFAGAASLLVVTAPRDRRGATSEPLSVISSGLRVRLIAIDGFDPEVFQELANAGRVPALARAFSAARARLDAGDEGGKAGEARDPARAWTTVATGQPPAVHGVRGLETRRIAGLQGIVPAREPSRLGAAIRAATDLLRLSRPAIASGAERREKTVWEVAADAGLRTAVVNWWATWPAAGTGAIVISDRAALRLEVGGALDAEIAPAELYEQLQTRWPTIRQEAARRAAAGWAGLPVADADAHKILERSAGIDAIQLTLAADVSMPEPDLVVVYLAGLDIAQHALLAQADAGAAPGASRVAARLQALRDYYVFLDRLLTDTLNPSADDLVVVVTEPGRVGVNADALMGIAGRSAALHATVSGRTTDVMPTVLHALGVPVSRDLAGEPLTSLFAAGFTGRYPVRHVASYGRPATQSTGRQGQPLDQEMIDRLRSLGYVR